MYVAVAGSLVPDPLRARTWTVTTVPGGTSATSKTSCVVPAPTCRCTSRRPGTCHVTRYASRSLPPLTAGAVHDAVRRVPSATTEGVPGTDGGEPQRPTFAVRLPTSLRSV